MHLMNHRTLAALLAAVLLAPVHAEEPTIRRRDAKAYRVLDASKRLPRLDAGDAERLLPSPWPPPRDRPPDRAQAEREARRQALEATCDADLVVLGRIEQTTPFLHLNGRWILTAHDVAFTQVVRNTDATATPPTRLRYIHPSGRQTVGGRVVTTVLDWFPPLVTDETLLLFLVRVGKGPNYRTSMRVPPLAVRGDALRDPGARTDGRRAALDGAPVSSVMRAVGAVVCRTPPPRPERRPSDVDWPWPEWPSDVP
jgi:hypothetical protein